MEKEKKEKDLANLELRISNLASINIEYVDYLRYIHNELQESKGNIRVFCRVRPLIGKENDLNNNSHTYIEYPNSSTIVLNGHILKSNVGKNKETQLREKYKFDKVFKPEDNQTEIFKEISQLVQSALDGYKVCIFAYGQTGSGKTFTMEGGNGENKGIISRSIDKIFDIKSQLESIGWKFNIEVSFIEIYLDQIRDLLSNNTNNIVANKDKYTNIQVNTVEDLDPILEQAAMKRAVAETMCNEKSSRSHSIFQLKIFAKNLELKQERNGAINLIDLAGSERVSQSKVENER